MDGFDLAPPAGMTLTFPEERRSGGSVGLRSNGSSRFASMCLLFCADPGVPPPPLALVFKGEGGIAGHEKVCLNTVGEEHKVKHYF